MALTSKPICSKWLIIGHYGGHNTGDEAMLMGLLWGMNQIGIGQTYVVTTESAAALEPFQAKAIPPRIKPVVNAILNCHGVILGGGSHFQDDYSEKRYWRHVRYMLRIVVISVLARLAGKRVLWLSMGFGPFLRPLTTYITRIGLWFCHEVTVRDTASLQTVSNWMSKRPSRLTLAFDLAALMLLYNPVASVLRKNKNEQQDNSQIIGISAVTVASSKTGGKVVNEQFWGSLASATETFLQHQPKVKIRIFIIRGGQREDDHEISQRLYERLSKIDPSRVELIPYQPDPMQTLQEIAQCDAFVVTRFHSGVLAYLAGCHLLFLTYHRKVKDLANEIGLSPDACLSLDQEVSETIFLEKLNLLLDRDTVTLPMKPMSEAVQQAFLNIKVLEKHI